MKKIRLKTVFHNLYCTFISFLTLLAIEKNECFAEDGIGTVEVQAATENIKRVITSIAMPLGRYINFC